MADSIVRKTCKDKSNELTHEPLHVKGCHYLAAVSYLKCMNTTRIENKASYKQMITNY